MFFFAMLRSHVYAWCVSFLTKTLFLFFVCVCVCVLSVLLCMLGVCVSLVCLPFAIDPFVLGVIAVVFVCTCLFVCVVRCAF